MKIIKPLPKKAVKDSSHKEPQFSECFIQHNDSLEQQIERLKQKRKRGEDFINSASKPKTREKRNTVKNGKFNNTSKAVNRPKRQQSDADNSSYKKGAEDISLDDFSDEFESKAEKRKLSPKSEYDILMHKAIHLLSMREHSVQELAGKLHLKTENADTVFSVMDFLQEHDYVSDARFTEVFVRSRANKGQGPIKIRADLRAKGVKPQLIDEHLDASAAIWV